MLAMDNGLWRGRGAERKRESEVIDDIGRKKR
jgi:hypothetical protein